MPKSSPAPEAAPGLVHIYPSPDLAPGEYLPGIGAAGADVPADRAADLIARGLAVSSPPDAAPAAAEKE